MRTFLIPIRRRMLPVLLLLVLGTSCRKEEVEAPGPVPEDHAPTCTYDGYACAVSVADGILFRVDQMYTGPSGACLADPTAVTNTLYRSADQGNNWNIVTSTLPFFSLLSPPGLHFTTSSTGYLFYQDPFVVTMHLYRTNDGGLTWTARPVPPAGFQKMAHAPCGQLFAYGASTTYVSTNGGPWTALANGPVAGVRELVFTSVQHGMARNDQGLWTTTNGGAGWQLVVAGDVRTASHLNEQVGAACRWDAAAQHMLLYHTTDDWATHTEHVLEGALFPGGCIFFTAGGSLLLDD
ncbi:MAG TPA: hypothetical protein VKG92_09285, partial [Flavobacteriales bacterium]|nr:hypothetical protein [Flavobacteriales bacterium]